MTHRQVVGQDVQTNTSFTKPQSRIMGEKDVVFVYFLNDGYYQLKYLLTVFSKIPKKCLTHLKCSVLTFTPKFKNIQFGMWRPETDPNHPRDPELNSLPRCVVPPDYMVDDFFTIYRKNYNLLPITTDAYVYRLKYKAIQNTFKL